MINRRSIIYDYSPIVCISNKSERFTNGYIDISEEDEKAYDIFMLKLEEWQDKIEGMRVSRNKK